MVVTEASHQSRIACQALQNLGINARLGHVAIEGMPPHIWGDVRYYCSMMNNLFPFKKHFFIFSI